MVEIKHHNQSVTTASWAPDGNSFVTGSHDKQSQLCLWTLDGRPSFSWLIDYRVQDCAISPDGQKMVTISSEQQISVYNFVTREEEYSMLMRPRMTCVSISRDSRYMLINMADNEVQLIDIESAEIVRRFLGQKQDEFIIRSCFGGADENLIISGSEGKLEKSRNLTSILKQAARFEGLHMAQRERHSNRDTRRPLTRLRQRCRMEPSRSMYVRLCWRRLENQNVRHPRSLLQSPECSLTTLTDGLRSQSQATPDEDSAPTHQPIAVMAAELCMSLQRAYCRSHVITYPQSHFA